VSLQRQREWRKASTQCLKGVVFARVEICWKSAKTHRRGIFSSEDFQPRSLNFHLLNNNGGADLQAPTGSVQASLSVVQRREEVIRHFYLADMVVASLGGRWGDLEL